MSCGCAASSLALALALALDAAGVSAAQPLVAEVSLGRNLILTAARGPPVLPRATSRLRSSPHRALRAGSRASYRDTMRRRGRASTDPSTLDPAATQFVLSIARPDPAHLRSFVEALDARLVRERLAAQVWSVVARARDCALLETRAGDAARAPAARDARLIAGAAGLTLGAAVASADVSEPAVDDDARMRCTLGTPRPPPRRANVAALTDTSARVTTGARIAIAFAAAGHESAGGTERADEASESDATVPPGLYGAARGQTRVRLDVARLGPTIVVVGTSARERPATLVRYSWTSSHVPGPRAALQVLAGARKRLIALGIPRTAIVTRVRSGPTAPANLFVDVPAGSRSGDAIASAIAGGDARVRASVGETYVRDRCDRLEARDARARLIPRANALVTSPARYRARCARRSRWHRAASLRRSAPHATSTSPPHRGEKSSAVRPARLQSPRTRVSSRRMRSRSLPRSMPMDRTRRAARPLRPRPTFAPPHTTSPTSTLPRVRDRSSPAASRPVMS